ncbi:MAG: GTPase [Promethearchaeota archaeon]
MVKGLAFFSWDTKMGATLELKYPLELKLTDELINKIYMTHSYEDDFKKGELIEITYKDNIILSYCDKSKVSEIGYEIILIILEEKEKINLYNQKSEFIKFARKFLGKSEDDKKKYFQEKIDTFFIKSSAKKILIIGRPGTGKTTIKKIVFEGYDPINLITNPLEPTRGISPSVYSWLDLKVGLFDSSGQELSQLLENNKNNDQILAFENTDFIVYLFDYPTWITNEQLIMEDIKQVIEILQDNSYTAQLILFIHKIDLIEKGSRKEYLKDLTNILKMKFDVSIYYTSIYPNLIYSLYNAFYELLSNFSKYTFHLKNLLDSMISNFSKTMFFITNLNDSIVAQSITKDFNTIIINHSHKLITQLNKTFENVSKNDRIEHLILSSSNLNIIMNSLNYQKFNLKNLVCFSETLSANKLIWTIGQIKQKLKNIYYFNKKI